MGGREDRVSRPWIYSQPDRRAEADRLRDRPRPSPAALSQTASAPPILPCDAASRSPHSASATWRPTTRGSALRSPRPSASSGPRAPANHHATRRAHKILRRSGHYDLPRQRRWTRRATRCSIGSWGVGASCLPDHAWSGGRRCCCGGSPAFVAPGEHDDDDDDEHVAQAQDRRPTASGGEVAEQARRQRQPRYRRWCR